MFPQSLLVDLYQLLPLESDLPVFHKAPGKDFEHIGVFTEDMGLKLLRAMGFEVTSFLILFHVPKCFILEEGK